MCSKPPTLSLLFPDHNSESHISVFFSVYILLEDNFKFLWKTCFFFLTQFYLPLIFFFSYTYFYIIFLANLCNSARSVDSNGSLSRTGTDNPSISQLSQITIWNQGIKQYMGGRGSGGREGSTQSPLGLCHAWDLPPSCQTKPNASLCIRSNSNPRATNGQRYQTISMNKRGETDAGTLTWMWSSTERAELRETPLSPEGPPQMRPTRSGLPCSPASIPRCSWSDTTARRRSGARPRAADANPSGGDETSARRWRRVGEESGARARGKGRGRVWGRDSSMRYDAVGRGWWRRGAGPAEASWCAVCAGVGVRESDVKCGSRGACPHPFL